MFTAVIPMMLVMRQADTLHEMRNHEVGSLDDERSRELLNLYVCPVSLTSPDVKVTIVNKGDVPAHVVKLWINDDPEQIPINVEIPSLSEVVLDSFPLETGPGKEYDIRATTERGNVFLSDNGILRYDMDGWVIESFGITVIIPFREDWMVAKKWSSNFNVTIWKVNEEDEDDQVLVYPPTEVIRAISASQQFFPLKEAGQYRIRVGVWVNNKAGTSAHWHNIYDKINADTFISWPAGSALITVPIVTPQSEHDHTC